MNIKPFTIKGEIRLLQRRLFVDGDECYGTADCEGRRFILRLSNIAIETAEEFMDTLLHEMLHLYLGMLMTLLNLRLSDAASHRIIEPTCRYAVRLVKRELRKRRRK